MVAPIVITALAYLHVVSGIGWLGAAFFFIMILTPGVKTLSPAASIEFIAKVARKAVRYFIGVASSTIIFGLLLLYFRIDGDFSTLGTPGFGQTITAGFTLGLIAYLIAVLFVAPTLTKASKVAEELMKNPPKGPPTELQALMKKGGRGSLIVLILLFVAVAYMVASGFPF